MMANHPGFFREVVPGFITLDLLVALLLTFLIVKFGPVLGGGMKGAVTIGILAAIIGPVLSNLYYFFSMTAYPIDLWAIESVYQVISHALQGALAAMIYKPGRVAAAYSPA